METTARPENWYWLILSGKTDDNLRNRIACGRETGDRQDVANCAAELRRRATGQF